MSTIATPASPTRPPVRQVEDDEVLLRLSVEQYHVMIQSGVFSDDERVELLEGLLVTKMPKNPAHVTAKRLLLRALEAVLPVGWFVDSQEPLTTSDSEPEPDLGVIQGDFNNYTDHHPGPSDSALIVEIADSSLRRDRGRKKRIYSRASVPVYWIVNLVDRQIEVYTDPTGPGETPDYRHHDDFRPGTSVPVVIDGKEVGRLDVAKLLP
jgi:Uma2 family endonuclease